MVGDHVSDDAVPMTRPNGMHTAIAVATARAHRRARSPVRRVAMLSMHTSPLAPLGGRETGGMNVYVHAVSAALARAGLRVDVFTRRTDPFSPEVQSVTDGVRLIHVPAGPAARVEKEEMDGFADEFAAGVSAFAGANGLRYDFVHSHYWLSAIAGRSLAREWDVPHVAMFHTLADVKLGVGYSDYEPDARVAAERALVHDVDRVVVATEHEMHLLGELYGVPSRNVAVIPPGVDRERFRPRERATARADLGLDPGARILLAAGRIERPKGFDVLIRALGEMTALDGTQLLIIGGDERSIAEVARLRRIAEDTGVSDLVHFVGSVTHEQIGTYYNAADVVVMPSRYESFGLVAAEAMASGTPVVASRVGGLASTVSDGRTGYLIPWRSPDLFAEKLDLLLEDAALRERMGANAADAMRVYDWRAVAAQLVDLYTHLVRDAVAVPASPGLCAVARVRLPA